MGLQSFLRSFISRDYIFYSLFDKWAAEIKGMGSNLRDLSFESNIDNRAEIIAKLKDSEKKNDVLASSIFNELSGNFITPFDREDIHALATSLDDISDNIFIASKKMLLYQFNPVTPEIQKMADLILESCHQVERAVNELKNMKNLKVMTEAITLIKEIESRSDDVFDAAIARFYSDDSIDAKEMIKRKEIFSKLESVSDKCEDAANTVESIIIKYA